ncbi:MAG: FAD-dependent oxidoreductase [Bdellovibrionales bacterium]|nr:FAD-dependent oxidoreductase [Bdellovibrionales bacterium]
MGSAYFDAHSLWQRCEKPLFTSIHQNMKADVCVVGGGIAGLTVAYMLLRQGQSVIVLDRERLGLGETGLTSAHLSNALDDRYYNLERLHGRDGARLAAESHTAAIDLIETIQAEEEIDCEFRRVDGFLFLSPTESLPELTKEIDAAHRAGLRDVRLLPRTPVLFFDSGPCLQFPEQAQFHPLKYIDGLAYAIQRKGGHVFTHSEVSEIRGGHPAQVKTTQGFTVECEAVVVATNTPINNRVTIHTKNPAYRTYVVGVPVSRDLVAPALLWDTGDPYHYIRFVKDPNTGEDILLVGGEDHRTGQDTHEEKHFANLLQWVHERFDVRGRAVTRWSGQVMEPIDGLAYIGRNPGDTDNVFIVTGDSGHGLTHGTLAGMLIADLVVGRDNPWATLYDPARLPLRSLSTYVKDAVESTMPYGDWLSEGDVSDVHQIEAGEGAVMRDGLAKLAVYKDEVGRLHTCSAVCTHLGGLVRWNSAEKTWDCPCHGSRFDRFGQVINGPANKELEPMPDPTVTNSETVITGP